MKRSPRAFSGFVANPTPLSPPLERGEVTGVPIPPLATGEGKRLAIPVLPKREAGGSPPRELAKYSTLDRARRFRRRWKIAFGTFAAIFTILLLLTQHRPGWYQTAEPNTEKLDRWRREATAMWDHVSWEMVQQRPFEVSLTDRAVTEWFALLAKDHPEWLPTLPPQVRLPVIRFSSGRIRLAAHCESGGWRAIVSLAFKPKISEDGGTLRLEPTTAYVGSLPVPKSIWTRFFATRLQWGDVNELKIAETWESPLAALNDQQAAVDSLKRLSTKNHFIWPNGHRPFRLRSIRVQSGELRLTIEPLPLEENR